MPGYSRRSLTWAVRWTTGRAHATRDATEALLKREIASQGRFIHRHRKMAFLPDDLIVLLASMNRD